MSFFNSPDKLFGTNVQYDCALAGGELARGQRKYIWQPLQSGVFNNHQERYTMAWHSTSLQQPSEI